MRMHARTRTHHAHDAAPAQAAVLRHPAEEREPEGTADALERVDGYLPNPPHPALRSAQAVSRTLEHAWRAPRRRPACREGRELEQGGEDSEDPDAKRTLGAAANFIGLPRDTLRTELPRGALAIDRDGHLPRAA